MQLRQMQYFITIVQHSSFTEAAEECFISQSAISQQMQGLEEELGVTLILRQGRHFTMTEAGEYFYEHSKAILDEIAQMQTEVQRIGNGHKQVLRIGTLRLWGGTQIRQAAAAFGAAHPDMKLTMMTGTHEELYEALQQGTIDIAFNDHRRVFSEQYVNLTVTSAFTYAELSSQNPLAGKHQLSLSDLQSLPCILIAPKERRSHEQDYYQATLGFGGSFLFAEDLEAARILVAANSGFLPIEGVEGLPEGGGPIHRIPIVEDGLQIQRNYCLFWKKTNDLPACRWFAEEFKAQF